MALSILSPHHPDTISFFKTDDFSGGVFKDETGRCNGTAVGLSTVDSDVGKLAYFDGSGYAYIENGIPLLPEKNYSLTLWFVRGSHSSTINFITHGAYGETRGSNYDSWRISTANSLYWFFEYGTGQNTTFYPGLTVPADQQLHIMTISVAEWSVEIMIDGAIATSFSRTEALGQWPTHRATTCGIGVNPYYWAEQYAGGMGRIRVHNRPITLAEHQALAAEQEYSIAGQVLHDGSPIATTVMAYDVESGMLAAKAETDINGNYDLELYSSDDVIVVPLMPAGYRPLAHGPVTPELRSL